MGKRCLFRVEAKKELTLMHACCVARASYPGVSLGKSVEAYESSGLSFGGQWQDPHKCLACLVGSLKSEQISSPVVRQWDTWLHSGPGRVVLHAKSSTAQRCVIITRLC
jgi:hypothetical protein